MTHEEFINKMIELHDFNVISLNFDCLREDIIYQYGYALHWGLILEKFELQDYQLEKYCQFWDSNSWMQCCHYQKLSEDFMIRHAAYLDWDMVSQNQHLSEQFIAQFSYYINWTILSCTHILTEDFAREWKQKIDWNYAKLDAFSEEFCANLAEEGWISWERLLLRKLLSEQFIRTHADNFDWGQISSTQVLSEDFVREYKDKISFEHLLANRNVKYREEFITQFKNKFGGRIWFIHPDNIIQNYGQKFYDTYSKYCS